VLRDFLNATRAGVKKTRIIGIANLNPASFQKYLESCTRLHLVRGTSEGYELTPRAEVVLDRIDRLLQMSSEVETALESLNRILGETSPGESPPPLRYVSRLAWSAAPRAPSAEPSEPRSLVLDRSGAYAAGEFKLDWDSEPGPAKPSSARQGPLRDDSTLEESGGPSRRYSRPGSRR